MMDSFVEAQNNLKRMSYAGCVTLFKTRQSHAARFSFMPMVMKLPGLKPIEAQNARSSSVWVPRPARWLPRTYAFPDRTIAQIAASDLMPHRRDNADYCGCHCGCRIIRQCRLSIDVAQLALRRSCRDGAACDGRGVSAPRTT